MNKRVLLFVLPFLLLGCSRTETNQTEKEIIEANIRVKNEIVQYRDEDGIWKDLTTVEILQNLTPEEQATESREFIAISGSNGTNGADGKAGTDGKEGQRGPQGIQGRTGATGAIGPRGNDGRNGKDGTQVTIAEDGELLLDGKGTGYCLVKKTAGNTPTPKPEPTTTPTATPTPAVCGAYAHFDEKSQMCVCYEGYEGDPYKACGSSSCGVGAHWDFDKENCICDEGLEGDPWKGCGVCGPYASWDWNELVCKCWDDHYGDPTKGCSTGAIAALTPAATATPTATLTPEPIPTQIPKLTPEPIPDNSITIGSVSDVNSAVKWCNANGISTTQDYNIGVGSFVFYYNGNERKEPGETVADKTLLRLVYNNGE